MAKDPFSWMNDDCSIRTPRKPLTDKAAKAATPTAAKTAKPSASTKGKK